MKQYIFSIDYEKKILDLYFIESDCNKLALKTIENPLSQWGTMPYPNSLIIKGPKSCGKTMLANIWQENNNAFRVSNNILDDNQISLYNNFIMEDIDEDYMEEEISLHNFNLLSEFNKKLLITLKKDSFTLLDLQSRIKSCNMISIDPPDDKLMYILIFKEFSVNSVKVKKEVITYLSKVLPRDFYRIKTLLMILNQKALEKNTKITIPFIKKILSHLAIEKSYH